MKVIDEEAEKLGWGGKATADNYKFDPEEKEWEGWMYVGEIPETLAEFNEPSVKDVKVHPTKVEIDGEELEILKLKLWCG